MIDDTLSQRARGCILGAAIGDAWRQHDSSGQQPLFAPTHLSDDVWLMLATCEAMARAGGRIQAAQLTAVLAEWAQTRRLRPASGTALHLGPLALALDPADGGDLALARDISRTVQGEAVWDVTLAALLAMRQCLDSAGVPENLLLTVATALPAGQLRERLFDLHHRRASPDALDPSEGTDAASEVVALALLIASRQPDGDLEAAASVAAQGHLAPNAVAAVTAQMLCAAGAEIPRSLVRVLPERPAVEAIVERLTQVLAGTATP